VRAHQGVEPPRVQRDRQRAAEAATWAVERKHAGNDRSAKNLARKFAADYETTGALCLQENRHCGGALPLCIWQGRTPNDAVLVDACQIAKIGYSDQGILENIVASRLDRAHGGNVGNCAGDLLGRGKKVILVRR